MKCYNIKFLLILIILGCTTTIKKDIEKKELGKDLFLEIRINHDTLTNNLVNGRVKFFHKKNDTLKIIDNDSIYFYLILGLLPHKESETNTNYEIDPFKKEIRIPLTNKNDTIDFPFDLNPSFIGKGVIKGILYERYELNYYFKDKIRMISTDYHFEKEVHIK